MNQGVPIVGDLSQVYPDIEGELCSRHSILMGKLKNTYNKIYDRTSFSIQTMTPATTSSSKASSIYMTTTTLVCQWHSRTG